MLINLPGNKVYILQPVSTYLQSMSTYCQIFNTIYSSSVLFKHQSTVPFEFHRWLYIIGKQVKLRSVKKYKIA